MQPFWKDQHMDDACLFTVHTHRGKSVLNANSYLLLVCFCTLEPHLSQVDAATECGQVYCLTVKQLQLFQQAGEIDKVACCRCSFFCLE